MVQTPICLLLERVSWSEKGQESLGQEITIIFKTVLIVSLSDGPLLFLLVVLVLALFLSLVEVLCHACANKEPGITWSSIFSRDLVNYFSENLSFYLGCEKVLNILKQKQNISTSGSIMRRSNKTYSSLESNTSTSNAMMALKRM